MQEKTILSFSFNRTYGNSMSDEGNATTYYFIGNFFKYNKLAVEITSLKCNNRKKISDKNFFKLEAGILELIDKYSLKNQAEDEKEKAKEKNKEPEFFATDVVSAFKIMVTYTNGDELKISSFPPDIAKIEEDLASIFKKYIK